MLIVHMNELPAKKVTGQSVMGRERWLMIKDTTFVAILPFDP